jgi:hypothetical protein
MEVKDRQVTFKLAGMTEFYDIIEKFDSLTISDEMMELNNRIKKLETKDKTDQEKEELQKLNMKRDRLNISVDYYFRKFLMRKALSSSCNGVNFGKEDTELFIDLQGADKLMQIFLQIKPDIEKNSQPQS